MSLRNIALVAHVDHGKTTLVDAMLTAGGVLGGRGEPVERILDSDDQEKERGITILAKAASLRWGPVRINLVDTPGHADFGGEVERALALVDGVLLLVDAAEGPMPQTRYVLSKALALKLPAVVVLNKLDRADARPEVVVDEVYELFFDLDADEEAIDFPIVSTVAREGRAMRGIGLPPPDADLAPLLDVIVETVPAPAGDASAPLRALVTNLDASDYLGRLAIGRVVSGTLRVGDWVALCPEDEAPVRRRLTHLLGFEGLDRVEVGERGAGDLFVVAGFPEVEIGDTLAAADAPEPLPRLTVDEPVIRMTLGANTSPLSGRDGRFLTSRQIRERLEREVMGNVSIRIGPTTSPEVVEIAGRGELQLAVLIETMRREGYEMQVSRPEVVTREIDETLHEPVERAVVDVPDAYVGAVTQALAPGKGRVTDLRPGDPGRTVVSLEAPARGLIGFRSELMSVTRGTALVHQHHAGWRPWAGELPRRRGGAMIADRRGTATAFALDNLSKRGVLFIRPGDEVYEGMIVGEASRPEEMVVNPTRAKQLTNIRTHQTDEAVKLEPPRDLGLEGSIEWIGDDELVEITPNVVRVRKRFLTEAERKRRRGRP